MFRGLRVLSVVATVLVPELSLSAIAALAQDRRDYLVFTDPGRRFSIEFPRTWKWTLVSASGEPIAVFVHPRSEAAVVVERFRMKLQLSPDEITETFTKAESDYIHENQPEATIKSAALTMAFGRKVILIEYERPGIDRAAQGERVRHYSFPVGQDLYRVTCMANNSQYARHLATLDAIVESLKPAGEISQSTEGRK